MNSTISDSHEKPFVISARNAKAYFEILGPIHNNLKKRSDEPYWNIFAGKNRIFEMNVNISNTSQKHIFEQIKKFAGLSEISK